MIYTLLFLLVLLAFYRAHLRDKAYKKRLLCILAFAERPLYGLELRPLLGDSIGQMYAVLDRLENEGLVQGEQRVREGDRPRRFFSLTEKGKEEAEKRIW